MNLVWDKPLPAMKPGRLRENAAARQQLEARLARLAVKFPTGASSSPVSANASGKWFEFGENDRRIKAVSFDFKAPSPTLNVQTSDGELRTVVGMNSWWKSIGRPFTNGLDRALSVPGNPLVAASGSWTAENIFTVKIVLYETPFFFGEFQVRWRPTPDRI